MPYNMEYALPSHNYHTATDMSGSDLFSVHLPSAHDAMTAAQSLGDSMTVNESQVNQVVTSMNNAQKQQQQQALAASLQAVPKVKRQDDIWTGMCRCRICNRLGYPNIANSHQTTMRRENYGSEKSNSEMKFLSHRNCVSFFFRRRRRRRLRGRRVAWCDVLGRKTGNAGKSKRV